MISIYAWCLIDYHTKLSDSNDVSRPHGRRNWIYTSLSHNKFKVLSNVNCTIYYNSHGASREMYILPVDSLYALNYSPDHTPCT